VNAPSTHGVARAAGIALVVILAAAAGLAAGNVLQQLRGDQSITAQASFSRDALDAVDATRGDRPAVAAYPDYAIRHAPASAAVSDWALRHPIRAAQLSATFRLTGPSDVESAAADTMTDTFRLTGPSDTGTELRGQRKAE
jgi:hypothetical protein